MWPCQSHPVSGPCPFLASTASCAHTGSPICAQNAPDSGMKHGLSRCKWLLLDYFRHPPFFLLSRLWNETKREIFAQRFPPRPFLIHLVISTCFQKYGYYCLKSLHHLTKILLWMFLMDFLKFKFKWGYCLSFIGGTEVPRCHRLLMVEDFLKHIPHFFLRTWGCFLHPESCWVSRMQSRPWDGGCCKELCPRARSDHPGMGKGPGSPESPCAFYKKKMIMEKL